MPRLVLIACALSMLAAPGSAGSYGDFLQSEDARAQMDNLRDDVERLKNDQFIEQLKRQRDLEEMRRDMGQPRY